MLRKRYAKRCIIIYAVRFKRKNFKKFSDILLGLRVRELAPWLNRPYRVEPTEFSPAILRPACCAFFIDKLGITGIPKKQIRETNTWNIKLKKRKRKRKRKNKTKQKRKKETNKKHEYSIWVVVRLRQPLSNWTVVTSAIHSTRSWLNIKMKKTRRVAASVAAAIASWNAHACSLYLHYCVVFSFRAVPGLISHMKALLRTISKPTCLHTLE